MGWPTAEGSRARAMAVQWEGAAAPSLLSLLLVPLQEPPL